MPRQYTLTWFAAAIHCDRRNLYYIFDRPTIDTGMLLRISEALGHNFFRDLADDFDVSNPTPAPPRHKATKSQNDTKDK